MRPWPGSSFVRNAYILGLQFNRSDRCAATSARCSISSRPRTEDEIRASALQFVRKLSGFNIPSKANEDAFNDAVEEVSDAARRLLQSLATTSPSRDRAVEAEKARAKSRERFARERSA